MGSFGGLGRFKAKRGASCKKGKRKRWNGKHTKAQRLGLYWCLLATTASTLYLCMNASVLFVCLLVVFFTEDSSNR
jgi:hypothetical protein